MSAAPTLEEWMGLLDAARQACENIMGNPRHPDEVREQAAKTHAEIVEAVDAMKMKESLRRPRQAP